MAQDNCINAQCIPKHLRPAITARARDTNETEALESMRETEQENMDTIQRLIREELIDVIVAYRPRAAVNTFHAVQFTLSVAMHFANDHPPLDPALQNAIYGIPMRCLNDNNLDFVVPRSQVRNLARLIQSVGPAAITLGVMCNGMPACSTRAIPVPVFTSDGVLNTAAQTTAVFTSHGAGETTALSTPTVHFSAESEAYMFRGLLYLTLTQTGRPGNSNSEPFPVESVRWVPDASELAYIMLNNVV